jgi:hypothetical protein
VLLCDRLARKGINVIVRASVRRHRSGQPHITRQIVRPESPLGEEDRHSRCLSSRRQAEFAAYIKADLAKWKKAIEDTTIPRIGG